MSLARNWPHFPTEQRGLSHFTARLLPLATRSQRGTRNAPALVLPLAAEQCPWCLCCHSGIKAKAEVTHWKQKWWGPRPAEGQGKDRDKAPNREGALEWRVLENVEQVYLMPSPSSLPLKSYWSLPTGYLARCPLQSVLAKHFFKSDLLTNGATWILCRWVGAAKCHMRFWGWYFEMGCRNGMLETNFMIPVLAEQMGTGRWSINHRWRCS